MKGMEIFQSGNTFYSKDSQAVTLSKKRKLGELKQKKVVYSIFEAVYLLETKKAKAKKKINLNKENKLKYLVFKDLRSKGYVPKTGLKFGSDFRVYENLKANHAKWLLFVLNEKEKIKIRDLAGKTRIAHSTKKDLLLAVIDSQEDITYYEVNWKRI